LVEKTATGYEVSIRISGGVWASTVAAASFTFAAAGTGATITAVARQAEASLVKITLGTITADGEVSFTAVAAAAVIGATGKVIEGLPLTVAVEV